MDVDCGLEWGGGAGGATYCAVAALRLMQGGGGEGEEDGEGMEEVRRWCAQVGTQKGNTAERGELIVSCFCFFLLLVAAAVRRRRGAGEVRQGGGCVLLLLVRLPTPRLCGWFEGGCASIVTDVVCWRDVRQWKTFNQL